MVSRPGAWATARSEIARQEVSLVLDLRSELDREHEPHDKALQNLTLMNRMVFDRGLGIQIPKEVSEAVRKSLTLPERATCIGVSGRLYAQYVNVVHNERRAFEKGRALRAHFYGEHRGVLLVGSAPRWWSVERLYVQCLLGDMWPSLEFHHV